ncbi:MAG TPA: hypothetical protein VGD76_00585 [Ramlibacter sp.]
MHPEEPSCFERWQQAEHAARLAESRLYQASLEHARGARGEPLDQLREEAARQRERARQLLEKSTAEVRRIVAALDAPGRSRAGPEGPR